MAIVPGDIAGKASLSYDSWGSVLLFSRHFQVKSASEITRNIPIQLPKTTLSSLMWQKGKTRSISSLGKKLQVNAAKMRFYPGNHIYIQ